MDLGLDPVLGNTTLHQDHGGVVNIKTRRSLIPEVFFTWPGILRLWKQKDENFELEAAVKAFYLLSRRM